MYKVSEADKLKMNRLEQQVQTVCKAQHCDDLFKHLTTVAQASKALAKQVFEIVDDAILSAICCHTTLKANPSLLDKTVFLADKIKWDGAGQPPYLADLLDALSISLSDGCLFYIEYILSHDIKVLHPWLLAAKPSLVDELGKA
jgi:HD superfamily phosphohydrolase YqeK